MRNDAQSTLPFKPIQRSSGARSFELRYMVTVAATAPSNLFSFFSSREHCPATERPITYRGVRKEVVGKA